MVTNIMSFSPLVPLFGGEAIVESCTKPGCGQEREGERLLASFFILEATVVRIQKMSASRIMSNA